MTNTTHGISTTPMPSLELACKAVDGQSRLAKLNEARGIPSRRLPLRQLIY
jgi:hypothetical protein